MILLCPLSADDGKETLKMEMIENSCFEPVWLNLEKITMHVFNLNYISRGCNST